MLIGVRFLIYSLRQFVFCDHPASYKIDVGYVLTVISSYPNNVCLFIVGIAL